jgi:hypothetical protein
MLGCWQQQGGKHVIRPKVFAGLIDFLGKMLRMENQ